MNNDEMAAWSAEWTSYEATTPQLSARMYKGRRLAAWGRWVHIVAAVVVNMVCVMFIIMNPKPVMWTSMIFISGFVWANSCYMWWITRIREESEPDNALGFMSAHRKLLQIRLKFLDVGTWGTGLVVGFIVTWVPWMLSEHWEQYVNEPWRAVVGVGGIFVILVLSIVMARRDRRNVIRELDELKRLEEEIGGSAELQSV